MSGFVRPINELWPMLGQQLKRQDKTINLITI